MYQDQEQFRAAWHEYGCQCSQCEPRVPSVPERLDATAMGLLALAGAAVGTAIAFIIDPAGAVQALLSTVGAGIGS